MTWLPSIAGRTIDLVHPTAAMIDFGDVAYALARIPRFLGRTRGAPLSVAQHCVMGGDAVLAETGSPMLAGVFLLHDAHEAFTGDIPTPVAEALLCHHGIETPDGPSSLANMKAAFDCAIYTAADLVGWGDARHIVRDMDLRLLKAERDALKPPGTRLWHHAVEEAGPIPSLGTIAPLPWDLAEKIWLDRLRAWVPGALRTGSGSEATEAGPAGAGTAGRAA